jgi:hypothetical protein
MCMKQYTLKMMRIGQSRVIYSGAEVPLGVVYTDDIYTYIHIAKFNYCPEIIILSRRRHHHHLLLLLLLLLLQRLLGQHT